MKSRWIATGIISLIIIGCGPPTRIQKTYIQVDQQKTGEVDIFSSFDEVGMSYKEVAELKVTDSRRKKKQDRNQMIESLKAKARKMGADGIVIIEEGDSVEKWRDPMGSGEIIEAPYIFIKCIAIIYG